MVIGLIEIPLHARLVTESEVSKLQEKRERVRREYEEKGWFLVEKPEEKKDELQ